MVQLFWLTHSKTQRKLQRKLNILSGGQFITRIDVFFCDSPKITHEYPFEAAQKQPSPYTYKRSRKCNRTQPLMHALHPTERARRLENQSTFCSVARTASKNINVTGFLIKKVTAFIFLLNVKNMPFWISLNVALGVSLLLYAHLLV